MRRCEDVKMRRCEDVKFWRCEDEKMRCEWGEDVKMFEDVKMRRWEDVKMRRCEDVEDVKMWRWEDEKMWRWEDVWRCLKMFEDVYNRPPLLEEPFAQTLSGKMMMIRQVMTGVFCLELRGIKCPRTLAISYVSFPGKVALNIFEQTSKTSQPWQPSLVNFEHEAIAPSSGGAWPWHHDAKSASFPCNGYKPLPVTWRCQKRVVSDGSLLYCAPSNSLSDWFCRWIPYWPISADCNNMIWYDMIWYDTMVTCVTCRWISCTDLFCATWDPRKMDTTGYGSITISEFEQLFEDDDMQADMNWKPWTLEFNWFWTV